MKMGREIVIVLQLSATYVEITKLRSCEDKYECKLEFLENTKYHKYLRSQTQTTCCIPMD